MSIMEKKAVPPAQKDIGKRLFGLVSHELLHPAKREKGRSYCQREIVRRNKAQYGKRQIHINLALVEQVMVIQRDYHMPMSERKKTETKPLAYLEHYRSALLTSGYVLLEGSPNSLIFQYEGRLH